MLKIDREDFIEISNKMYRLALSIVKDSQISEDIVQDVWLKLLENDYKINNLQVYLMRATKNASINYVERDNFYKKKVDSNLINKLDNDLYDNNNILNNSIAKERYLEILNIVESLPETQKRVMTLRDIEGFEINDISNILEISENAVSVNLSRARKYVREKLLKK